MASSENVAEARLLTDQAHHYTLGDGADAATGAVLAAEAQVYATLALVEVVQALTETLHSTPERMVHAIEAADRDASERTSRAIKDATRHP